jgi:hypothetical protein
MVPQAETDRLLERRCALREQTKEYEAEFGQLQARLVYAATATVLQRMHAIAHDLQSLAWQAEAVERRLAELDQDTRDRRAAEIAAVDSAVAAPGVMAHHRQQAAAAQQAEDRFARRVVARATGWRAADAAEAEARAEVAELRSRARLHADLARADRAAAARRDAAESPDPRGTLPPRG